MATLLYEIGTEEMPAQYMPGILKNYKEPTIVLMYGDHQPSLSDAFYDSYMDTTDPSAKYKTPFLIWSNFTLPKAENTVRVQIIWYLI